MSNAALAAMGVGNLIVAAGFWRAGNYGMALTFTSYATACAGFIWANIAGANLWR